MRDRRGRTPSALTPETHLVPITVTSKRRQIRIDEHRSLERRDRSIALALILVAFVLRIWALDAKGLAYDEAATALMSRASLPEIVAFHWDAAFEHLPLWIVFMNGWSKVAGQSEFALRLPSALAGTLTIPLLWLLLRRLRPADLAWRSATSSLVAVSPVLILYSQEARMYAFVVLFAIASVLLLLQFLDRPRALAVIAFILVNWALLGLQYYSALLIAAEALFVLVVAATVAMGRSAGGSAVRNRTVAPLIAIAVSFLPLLVWMAYAPGFHETVEVVLREASRAQVSVPRFASDAWRDLSFGAIRWQPSVSAAGFLLLPIFLTGLIAAFQDGIALQRDHASAHERWALLFALIVFVPLLVSAIALRTLATRYMLYIVPFLFAFAGFGIAFLWRVSRTGSVLVGAIAIGIAVAGTVYYFGSYTKSEYREMAAYLRERYAPANDVVYIEAPRQHLLAKYYLGQSFPLQPIPDVPMPEYWPLTAPRVVPEEVDDVVQAALEDKQNVWLVLSAEAEVDPGEFLSKYLTAVAYMQDCEEWLDVRLCQYTSPRTVDFQMVTDLGAQFNGELVLERSGIGLPARIQPEPEVPLHIRLDWYAERRPLADYKVSVKLLSTDGQILAQADQYPIGPLLPPTTWAVGDRKPGYMVLPIPGDLPRGSYELQASVYDPQTMQSIAPSTAGANDLEPQLELGLLEIGDTMRLRPPVADARP